MDCSAPRPIVTLLTDFGEQGGYVAQMKAAILERCRDAVLVDISHSVAPQDIASAAWLLRDTVAAFPADTIHVAVVDPGVGSARRLLGIQTAHGLYVAPDNGLLTLVAHDFQPVQCFDLDNPAYWRPNVSSTFHGRDIMGPIAGHLASGVPFAKMGSPVTEWVTLSLPRAVLTNSEIHGVIIRIDAFGNLITNITAANLAEMGWDGQGTWECRGQRTDTFLDSYAAGQPGCLVAVVGSSARVELSVVNGNAQRALQAAVGESVQGRRTRHGGPIAVSRLPDPA